MRSLVVFFSSPAYVILPVRTPRELSPQLAILFLLIFSQEALHTSSYEAAHIKPANLPD
jgi:hypothetical protein